MWDPGLILASCMFLISVFYGFINICKVVILKSAYGTKIDESRVFANWISGFHLILSQDGLKILENLISLNIASVVTRSVYKSAFYLELGREPFNSDYTRRRLQ